MADDNALSRRQFIGAVAAVGAVGLSACATNSQPSRLWAADRTSGKLPPRGEFDLILVRTNDINVAPFINPALLLVQQASPFNVDTVVIDGRILKHKGELVAIDT
ncbi:MAG: twin-arginine translocation signal domain-containing protein, partial [Candidatus Binatia bacterium]